MPVTGDPALALAQYPAFSYFITALYYCLFPDRSTIQLLTGHSDTKSLVRYIEADPERIKKALALL